MFSMNNNVVVVTGGSSGIGLATVKLLISIGAKVAFCGRNQVKILSALKEINAPDTHIYAAACDVLDKQETENFVKSVIRKWGRIDNLICNAGQANVGHLESIADETWLSEVQLKLFSVLNIIKSAKPYLSHSEFASITCVNSLLALQPEPHMIATSAARAHLLNFTHNLANEYIKDNIRVNSILVGMIDSGQWRRRFEQRKETTLNYAQWTVQIAQKRGIPMGRLGKPEEAAKALVFLASPLSSYTTGSCLDVSGGFSKHI